MEKTRTVKVGAPPRSEVTIWYDETCRVWVQGAFWWGVKGQVQIQPSREFGLAALTKTNYWNASVSPMKGWIIYRPTVLVLDFKHDVMVHLECIEKDAMQCYARDTLPWIGVGRGRDNARNKDIAW